MAIEDVTYDNLDEPYITSAMYEDATRVVVKTLGREAECDVVFAGSGAAAGITDGGARIVTLPSNPPDAKMTKRQYYIGQGFANHETLHNLCTDLAGLAPRIKALNDQGKHLTFALANGIEDVRIEKAGGLLYPGIPNKLHATAQFASEHFLSEAKEKPGEFAEILKDFNKIGPIAMTWEGRKRLGYDAPAIQQCIDMVDPAVMKRVKAYMDVVDKIQTGVLGIGNLDRKSAFKGSHEVVDLAEWIVSEEGKEEDKNKAPNKGVGTACGDEDEDGDGDGDGDEGGKGGDFGDGNSDEFIKQKDDTQGEPIDPDMLSRLRDKLTIHGKPGDYVPYTRALDTWVTRKYKTKVAEETLLNNDNLRQYKKCKDQMTGKLAIMSRKLSRALVSMMDTEYTSGHRSGQLDIRGNVVKILQGRENVYKKKTGGKDVSAAVTLLIDASGSMNGSRIALAQRSAIALAESIAKVGVPLEVLVFNTRRPQVDEITNLTAIDKAVNAAISAEKKSGNYRKRARLEPLCIYEVKAFDDNMQIARKGLGGINRMVSSANADGECLLKAWDRLKKRKEQNKVLIVLSDGQPSCCSEDEGRLVKHLRDSVLLIEKEGGTCVGIGVQSNCVDKFYKKYTVVNNINELAGVTIDNVARMIIGGRFHADSSALLAGDAREARNISG